MTLAFCFCRCLGAIYSRKWGVAFMATVSEKFKTRLWAEYPIPSILSVFGGDMVQTFPVADLDTLIETCVDELQSDVYVTEYVLAGSMGTQLPEDTIAVVGGKMTYGFQGNRAVKCTFDAATKIVWTRYYPANITYRRRLHVEDLDKLTGDMLQYTKMYMLWKMADREITMLTSVNFEVDNASVNLDSLTRFRDACRERYLTLKEDIMLYTVGN